jgi:hypothetical protein
MNYIMRTKKKDFIQFLIAKIKNFNILIIHSITKPIHFTQGSVLILIIPKVQQHPSKLPHLL